MKTTKPTATEAYKEKQADAAWMIERLALRLKKHAAEQKQEPTNWGFVGDLGRINEELAYVLAAFGDREAVEKLGLKY